MRSFFRKILKLREFLLSLSQVNQIEDLLSKYFRSKRQGVSKSPALVLVQCVEDPYYFALFGQIVLSLREHCNIRVESYVHRSLNVYESRSGLFFFLNRLVINFFTNRKWQQLYASFCDHIGYDGRTRFVFVLRSIADFFSALRHWRSLKNRAELDQLLIHGISVGDLVTDSYLRYKPAATVEFNDFYLCVVIWQAYRDIYRSQCQFSKDKPKFYLTSYSTYVQHGAVVRVALSMGVRVFSFGNYQEFVKELTLDDWVHTRDTRSYAKDFYAMDARDDKLVQALEALSLRIGGGIDSATAYMKQSAYAETGEVVPDVRGAVIVFLHDFFDSPHVYHDMVFSDFWQWICFTIESFSEAQVPFYIKPHPNQIDLSQGVLQRLTKRYPQTRILSTKITNKQLAEAGIVGAVTVYGTVAHEMAFLGIPSIASARHPHVSFDFCVTTLSESQYKDALLTFKSQAWDAKMMREQSCAFYFMHNLNLTAEAQTLLQELAQLRNLSANKDGRQVLLELQKIAGLVGFNEQIGKWISVISPLQAG